jgi:hypothetical protein
MRSHGVTNLPDDPGARKRALTSPSAQAPAVQSAERACAHLLPHGGVSPSPPPTQAQVAAILAFARCIRTHGFSTFPDPNTSGQLTHQMLASAGINVHQPAVVQAADACVGVTNGVVTRATIARFVAGH